MAAVRGWKTKSAAAPRAVSNPQSGVFGPDVKAKEYQRRAEQTDHAIAALDHLWVTMVVAQRLPPAVPMLWWGASKNPTCFMDIHIGNAMAGRLIIQLFANVVPRAAENFRGLCTGEYSTLETPCTYQGGEFRHIVKRLNGAEPNLNVPVARTRPRFMCEGRPCDLNFNESVYGGAFDDETFDGPAGCYAGAGVVAMSNAGPNTNRCQFFITFTATPWLAGLNVVVGRVHQSSFPVLAAIERVGSMQGTPDVPVTIFRCGQLQ